MWRVVGDGTLHCSMPSGVRGASQNSGLFTNTSSPPCSRDATFCSQSSQKQQPLASESQHTQATHSRRLGPSAPTLTSLAVTYMRAFAVPQEVDFLCDKKQRGTRVSTRRITKAFTSQRPSLAGGADLSPLGKEDGEARALLPDPELELIVFLHKTRSHVV